MPPGSLEFTATLFDLIRRGRYRAEQVTTERKIWGGLKTQQISDLELSLGDVEAPVEAFEAPVAQVVDSIVVDGPERLSRFRDRIEDDRTGNSERFTFLQVRRRARKRRTGTGSGTSGLPPCSVGRPCSASPAG